VDLVDSRVAFEEGGYKHERRDEAVPDALPEPSDRTVVVWRILELVWSTGENA